MNYKLSGKRALLLASRRGLGLGIAQALAAEGVNVLLCGRSEDERYGKIEEFSAVAAFLAS